MSSSTSGCFSKMYSDFCYYISDMETELKIKDVKDISDQWDQAESVIKDNDKPIDKVLEQIKLGESVDIGANVLVLEEKLRLIESLYGVITQKLQETSQKICGQPKKQFQARLCAVGGFVSFIILIAGNISQSLANDQDYNSRAVTWITVACVVSYIVLAKIGDYYSAKWAGEEKYIGQLKSLKGRASIINYVKRTIVWYRLYEGNPFELVASQGLLNGTATNRISHLGGGRFEPSYKNGDGTPFGPGSRSMHKSYSTYLDVSGATSTDPFPGNLEDVNALRQFGKTRYGSQNNLSVIVDGESV